MGGEAAGGAILSSDEIECPEWLHELEDQSRWEGDVRSPPSRAPPSSLPRALHSRAASRPMMTTADEPRRGELTANGFLSFAGAAGVGVGLQIEPARVR